MEIGHVADRNLRPVPVAHHAILHAGASSGMMGQNDRRASSRCKDAGVIYPSLSIDREVSFQHVRPPVTRTDHLMASAKSLHLEEVSLIKAMLLIRPRLTYQQILSYFTRPGRDLNHRLISQIANKTHWTGVPPAMPHIARAFMAAAKAHRRQTALPFMSLAPQATSGPGRLVAFDLRWWPVGQGLFMSGQLEAASGPTFTWVYDCGTHSERIHLDRAIARFDGTYGPGKRIDLLVLSHFDEDHINGVTALLRNRQVGTILLPHLLPWQRLLIALEEGLASDSPLFQFYLAPAGYLSGIEGAEIGEVVFVPGAGPDDVAPPAPEVPEGPAPDRGIEGLRIDYGPAPEDGEALGDEAPNSGKRAAPPRPTVNHLSPGGRLVIPSLWEFIPHHDARMLPKVTPRFRQRAGLVLRYLRDNPARREKALALLKKIYVRTFGKGGTNQNRISLFLYSGPVGITHSLAAYATNRRVVWNAGHSNYAQLSTGDGFLEKPAQLAALQRFYAQDQRLDRAGILQVMHHGARANWHKGLGRALRPAVSIFSSDPARKRPAHPHLEVLRDFWGWCPVQVDMDKDFHLIGLVRFP